VREVIEELKKLEGKEQVFNFKVLDDTFLWSEDEELLSLGTLSTSALLENVHRCGYSILKSVIPSNYVSVVGSTSIKHLSVTPVHSIVSIKILVKAVNENRVTFEGEAFDEFEKVASFSFERVVVSLGSVSRKIKEKSDKIKSIN
jgi:predicted thioesterase